MIRAAWSQPEEHPGVFATSLDRSFSDMVQASAADCGNEICALLYVIFNLRNKLQGGLECGSGAGV